MVIKWQVLVLLSFLNLKATGYELFGSNNWHTQIQEEVEEIQQESIEEIQKLAHLDKQMRAFSPKEKNRDKRGEGNRKSIACFAYVHRTNFIEGENFYPLKHVLWYPVEWGQPENFVQISTKEQKISEGYIYGRKFYNKLKKNY